MWILEQGKPAPREVKTGLSDGRYTEILGGTLKEGDAVIVGAAGSAAGGGAPRGMRGGMRIL